MTVHDDLVTLRSAEGTLERLRAADRVQAEIERLTQERDAALRGNWKQDPTGEGGLGKEEQYWLRNKLRSAVVHLRDIEDYYVMRGGTPESPNLERARRARSLYEQISEDFINGSLPVPTMRDRAEAAEAALADMRRALETWGRHKPGCHFLHEPGLGRAGSGQECDCGLAAALAASEGAAPSEAMPEACPRCGCLTYRMVNTSLHSDAPDGAVLCTNCGKGWVHSTDERGLIRRGHGLGTDEYGGTFHGEAP